VTQEEFKVLFEAYFEEIRRYIFFRSGNAVISTDIAQDTFLKIWENQVNLEPGRDIGYLYKVAGNLLISHYRREKLSKQVSFELKLAEQGERPDQGIDYMELKDQYKRALKKLPDKQRVVFMMSRMERFSYPEIAERLNISIKAVEKRMNRALKYLRSELGQA